MIFTQLQRHILDSERFFLTGVNAAILELGLHSVTCCTDSQCIQGWSVHDIQSNKLQINKLEENRTV